MLQYENQIIANNLLSELLLISFISLIIIFVLFKILQ